jgi:hypothetical protein
MTTGHSLTDIILRLRTRPRKSSTNATVAREAFGDMVKKELWIPVFIDSYNQGMNGVDLANQLRKAFSTHFHRCQKEFFPGMF